MKGKLDDTLNEGTLLIESTNPNYLTFTNTSWWNDYLPAKSWKEYLPSPTNVAYFVSSMVLTIPFLPYTLTPTPAIDLINDTWWSSLTPLYQTFLIGSALVYLIEGSATRYKYLQIVVDNLKNILGNGFGSVSSALLNSMTIIVAGVAAIPVGTLGYFGTKWAGQTIAMMSGALNFLMTWAMRMVFLPNFFSQLMGLFDGNKQFQKKLINYMHSLKPEESRIINHRLLTIDQSMINEQMIHDQFIQIFDKAERQSLFVKNNVFDLIRKGFAVSGSMLVGAALSLFLSQAGYEGAKLLCFAITTDCSIEHWAYIAKLALIFIPGFTAAVVGFMPTFELIDETLVDVFRHIKQKPRDILKVLLIVGVCGLTAMSIQNAAIGMANKANLFALTPDGKTLIEKIYYSLYRFGNYGAGIALELGVCLKMLGLNDEVATTATVDKSIHWLRKNPLSEKSIQSLKEHSFFRQPVLKNEKKESEVIFEMESVAII